MGCSLVIKPYLHVINIMGHLLLIIYYVETPSREFIMIEMYWVNYLIIPFYISLFPTPPTMV